MPSKGGVSLKDWNNTLVLPSNSISEILKNITASSLQIALVTDDNGRLLGTVTDGDIRRAIINGISLDKPIKEIMRINPKVGHSGHSQQELTNLMKTEAVNQLPIVDDNGRVVGLVSLIDIIRKPSVDNRVILMAGGLGRRLKPITDNCPKPMVSVGGKPVLETILESFIEQGFGYFSMSVNHLAEQIKEHFGDGSRWGVEIDYIVESKKMGTAGALSLLETVPQLPVIVMNADLLTKVSYNNLLNFHNEQDAAATMCVREYSLQIPYGVVRIESNMIKKVDEKPVQHFFVNAGIYVINPEVIKLVPESTPYDMTTLFNEVVKLNMKTTAFPIQEYWIDIGHRDDFEKANNDYDNIFLDK